MNASGPIRERWKPAIVTAPRVINHAHRPSIVHRLGHCLVPMIRIIRFTVTVKNQAIPLTMFPV